MSKNYSGSDLSKNDKSTLNSYIRKIKKILTEKGCSNFDFHYGFHYVSGFFTAKNGTMYYICSNDTRFGSFSWYYRTVKHYKDYSGGSNNHIDCIDKLKEKNF